MASQKRWNIPSEEQLRNKELFFHWNKSLPINGEAKNPTDFQLEPSLLHKENIQLASKPKHSRTLKRGFQSISTMGMSPQHQGVVTKPLSVRIIPVIGTSTSCSINGDLKFCPPSNGKSLTSFSEEIQKCTSPLRRESDVSKGKAVVNGTDEGFLMRDHKLDCEKAADAQVSKVKLYQEGITVTSSLALLEPTQIFYSSEGPTNLLKYDCHVGSATQRPPESGSPICTTSPISSNISHKDVCAPPLAPQKVKDFQKLTHVSKRGLDHQFEKQQITISRENVAAYSSGDKIIADMNALQPTQRIDRPTACFQAQIPCRESNIAAMVENTKLQIYLDCQSSMARNAVSKMLNAVDGLVPEHSVGFQKVAVLEFEGKKQSYDSSAEINHSSSNSGQASLGDKERFRESTASTMQRTERHFPRSRFLMSPAYAPIPVPAPVFSSGEPSLPLLMTSSQSSSELVQTSSHFHEGSLKLSHMAPLDLKKLSCSQSLENRSKENINSGKSLSAYQKRFINLQAFLRLCDEADQIDLLQALRSLSAPARSGHAFNLETRALRLSVEEGKEMIRLKMLNVMGRILSPKGQKAELGSTPAGIRLPAPSMPSSRTLDAS